MPTPFMHMALAKRLIADPVLPDSAAAVLRAEWGAFLLGSVAPDARVSSGTERQSTHFFDYAQPYEPHAIAEMLRQYPTLGRTVLTDGAQVAFVAGYAAHLAMDVAWSTDMLFPYFFTEERWEDRQIRFLVLHLLLAHLDARDLVLIPAEYGQQLAAVMPMQWLPFMPDDNLVAWRDTIANQLLPGGESRTAEILASRVSVDAQDFSRQLHDQALMQQITWDKVPLHEVAQIEEAMYLRTRDSVIAYLGGEQHFK